MTLETSSIYAPLSSNAFSSAGFERKSLADDFLGQFLASKVNENKKKEIKDNLNSYSPFNSTDNKILFTRKLNKTKSKKLTAKEKRALKIYDIPKNQKFSDFFSLHLLWEQYMITLLELEGEDAKADSEKPKNGGGGGAASHHDKIWLKQLQSADFHGNLVTIVKSTNATLQGKSGIIIAETRNTFKMATPKDVVITVPKENCVFAFEIKGWVFTMYGNNLRQRSAARSGKKFKFKGTNPLIILDF